MLLFLWVFYYCFFFYNNFLLDLLCFPCLKCSLQEFMGFSLKYWLCFEPFYIAYNPGWVWTWSFLVVNPIAWMNKLKFISHILDTKQLIPLTLLLLNFLFDIMKYHQIFVFPEDEQIFRFIVLLNKFKLFCECRKVDP